MRSIHTLIRKALAALLFAAFAFAAVFPAAAEAEVRRRRTDERPAPSPAVTEPAEPEQADPQDEDEGEPKSLLSPYDENGEIRLTRTIQHTPDDDFSFMRVLVGVGSVSSISFDLVGSYYIGQNLTPLYGSEEYPAQVTIQVSGGNVRITHRGAALYSGAQLDIMRTCLSYQAGWAQLHTSGYDFNNNRKYLGHLHLTANADGTVRFVNVIPTAHYLYGIIPYEMSESCNIEALKAQAVTAKTYAFGFTYTGSDYDITDSFTYQGYRGYNEGYVKCMSACLGVRGKLLFYNGGVPLAFYGATNGGETALPSHAFGTSPLDSAYEIKLDNIDVQYGSSKLKTLDITYGEAVGNSSFRRLLADQAEAALGHSVEVICVLSADVNTPKFTGTTRNLTKMDVTMKVLDGGEETQVIVRFDVTKLKSYGVFSNAYKIYWGKSVSGGYRVYFARWGHGLGLSQYGADGHAAEGYNYNYILNFYFGKMQLTSVREDNPERPYAYTLDPVAYGVVNTAGTRLRGAPTTDGQLFASFAVGTHVKVISESQGWLLCIADGILGYIRGDLVDIVLFPSPTGAQHPIGRGLLADGFQEATLYSGPSEYCEAVLTVGATALFDVWNEIGFWYRVRVNGEFYYVRKECVTVRVWLNLDLHKYLVNDIAPVIRPRP